MAFIADGETAPGVRNWISGRFFRAASLSVRFVIR